MESLPLTMPQGTPSVAIVGGGPAGLMAAEVLSQQGVAVDVYDAMPSVGRKFLLAGVGGMNLTHSEPRAQLLSRYGVLPEALQTWLEAFDGEAVRAWALGLGIETFVGSSGRVFPTGMKAAPLLRAWLHRLKAAGVRFHARHRCEGWNADGALRLLSPAGEQIVHPDAVILALGGGSWAKLGSDGTWVSWLMDQGVDIAPLRPSNCGFDVGWSEHFQSRYAGHPLKSVLLTLEYPQGETFSKLGECVVTAGGVEGSLIYAASSRLRDAIEAQGSALFTLDLMPHKTLDEVFAAVSHPRGSRSLSSHVQSRLGLKDVKLGLLWEALGKTASTDMLRLAQTIKALPIRVQAPRPLDEAISSAGGVRFAALDDAGMVRAKPGVFCAGEMLDWEAPTGGYLLTACLASGRAVAWGAYHWLQQHVASRR